MPGHARSSLSHRVGSIALYGASLASCTCVIQARRWEHGPREERREQREERERESGYLLNYVRCSGRGLPSLHKTRRTAPRCIRAPCTTSKFLGVPLERLDSPGILRDRRPTSFRVHAGSRKSRYACATRKRERNRTRVHSPSGAWDHPSLPRDSTDNI